LNNNESTVKNKLFNFIKAVTFCAVFLALFVYVISPVFKVHDFRCKQIADGFYAQPENSIDVITIGASNSYAAWQPPFAYKDYGFTSYTLSFPHMPNTSLIYFLDEARKTQPDALYLISLNGFTDKNVKEEHFHHSLDYLPLSDNKLKMIKAMINDPDSELTEDDIRSLYLPFYQFHSSWDSLESKNYYNPLMNIKGAQIYGKFLDGYAGDHDKYVYTDKSSDIEEFDKALFDDLIEYIRETDAKVVFAAYPQSLSRTKKVKYFNGAIEYLRKADMDVLEMMPEDVIDDIGLDLAYDYYDLKHMKIHGSLKLIHYAGAYLKDKYDLPDHHSESIEQSWDSALSEYRTNYADSRLADFEWEYAPRDYSIGISEITSLTPKKNGFVLEWSSSDKADGYAIFRKNEKKDPGRNENPETSWERVAEISADKGSSFRDKIDGLQHKTDYTYAVVPYRIADDGSYIYGRFDHEGESCESAGK